MEGTNDTFEDSDEEDSSSTTTTTVTNGNSDEFQDETEGLDEDDEELE